MNSVTKHFRYLFINKTWNGLTRFDGQSIWTDGDNIYYSESSLQRVLDKSTSTWSTKTWNGFWRYFDGQYIWTDGDNIYYSNGSDQYILDKSTSTWSRKAWNGFTGFDGHNIWTDEDNIYYSDATYSKQNVLTLYSTEYVPSIRTTSCKVKFT